MNDNVTALPTALTAASSAASKIISLREIAVRIGVNYETARRWAHDKRLPVFKFNGKGRWFGYEDQVDDFVEKHKNVAATWSSS